jgi:YggT family protein
MAPNPFLDLGITIINLYSWVIIFRLIMSWLTHFNVVNTYHPFVQKFNYALYKLTEPVLAPIRRFMPDLGGIDISPIIVFIVLEFIMKMLLRYTYAF